MPRRALPRGAGSARGRVVHPGRVRPTPVLTGAERSEGRPRPLLTRVPIVAPPPSVHWHRPSSAQPPDRSPHSPPRYSSAQVTPDEDTSSTFIACAPNAQDNVRREAPSGSSCCSRARWSCESTVGQSPGDASRRRRGRCRARSRGRSAAPRARGRTRSWSTWRIPQPLGELAALVAHARYSMTWSARPSSDCGIVRPSAFAVLRLMTSSNVVGSSIGKSPGFAPFRTLSTYRAARRNESLRLGA